MNLIEVENSDKLNSNNTYRIEFNFNLELLKNISILQNKILVNEKNKKKIMKQLKNLKTI